MELSPVLLCSQARLPQEMTPPALFIIFVVAEKEEGRVLEVGCCPTAPLLERFLQEVMTGRSLVREMEDILQQVESRFFNRMKRAVLTAVKDLQTQFLESRDDPHHIPFPAREGEGGEESPSNN